ncbi:RHS repeat-associated core domain-containing protein [Pseudomonas sp. S1(2024)]|uniref:RHS repeat-associated core domain-containing protein n=1 Tax=Pseudomonas sp. S1(2024) TaxID=3390191 RepID=UPI00397B9BD1
MNRLFYQNAKLHSSVGTGNTKTVFRISDQAFSLLHCTTLHKSPILFAIDHAGSVIGNLTFTRDKHIAYTPFGYTTVSQADSHDLAFNDQWLFATIGGYLLGNGHRLYRPDVMRLCSSDDNSPFGDGGFNAYAYCLGDPVNRHDPTGKSGESLKKVLTIPLPRDQIFKHLSSRDLANFSRASKTTYSSAKGYSLRSQKLNQRIGSGARRSLLPVDEMLAEGKIYSDRFSPKARAAIDTAIEKRQQNPNSLDDSGKFAETVLPIIRADRRLRLQERASMYQEATDRLRIRIDRERRLADEQEEIRRASSPFARGGLNSF